MFYVVFLGMQAIEARWDEIKETIRKEYDLSDVSYHTWIEPLKFFDVQDDVVIILITSNQSHALNYISSKYKDFFRVTITEMMDHYYEVSFILEKDARKDKSSAEDLKSPFSGTFNINYENANLNPKYKFDTFVVGSNNKFAHSACLAVAESDKLFSILRSMRDQGCAVIIITHKLNEVLAISDRVTILRKGKSVATVATAETNAQELTELMVGKKVSLQIERPCVKQEKALFEVHHLSVRNEDGVYALNDISFDLNGGEILGVAGVAGSGQTFEHVTCSLPVFSFSLYSSSVSSAICTGRASRSISMPCRASLYNLCPLTETAEYIGGTCKISPRKESSAVSSAALKTGVSSVLMTSPVTSPVVYASPNRKDAS